MGTPPPPSPSPCPVGPFLLTLFLLILFNWDSSRFSRFFWILLVHFSSFVLFFFSSSFFHLSLFVLLFIKPNSISLLLLFLRLLGVCHLFSLLYLFSFPHVRTPSPRLPPPLVPLASLDQATHSRIIAITMESVRWRCPTFPWKSFISTQSSGKREKSRVFAWWHLICTAQSILSSAPSNQHMSFY